MSTQLHKSLPIKGAAIWVLDQNGQPVAATPQADNVPITLPSIDFGTTDVNIMGTVSIPDFTRVENFQVTAEISVDNPDSKPLKQVGKQAWKITYCTAHIDAATGLETLQGMVVYCTGYIGGIPNAEVNQGSENTATVTMNCMSFKKQTQEGVIECDIDRSAGKIEIDGKNYTEALASKY